MYDNEEHDIRVVHNSAASCHGLIVCVDVDQNRSICDETEREIMTWLGGILKTAHESLDPDNLWHYVYGVRHDQCSDPDGNYKVNGLQITLHFAQDTDDAYAWPLFRDNAMLPKIIHASDVLLEITPAPMYVRTLGVSAVQKQCLVHEWMETISTDTAEFCHAGHGIGVHSMYTLHKFTDTPNPLESLEMSHVFGWHDA